MCGSVRPCVCYWNCFTNLYSLRFTVSTFNGLFRFALRHFLRLSSDRDEWVHPAFSFKRQNISNNPRRATGRKFWYSNTGGQRTQVISKPTRQNFDNAQIVCVQYEALTNKQERDIFKVCLVASPRHCANVVISVYKWACLWPLMVRYPSLDIYIRDLIHVVLQNVYMHYLGNCLILSELPARNSSDRMTLAVTLTRLILLRTFDVSRSLSTLWRSCQNVRIHPSNR